MVDLQDRHTCPSLEEIGEYVRNPVFARFCDEVKEKYGCQEILQYSSCSLAPGWNVKFRKGGRALCTLYPREGYVTIMVVVGRKEKEAVEAALPDCDPRLRELYYQTQEGNGQRWLMIDVEDPDRLYQDVFCLLQIRRKP